MLAPVEQFSWHLSSCLQQHGQVEIHHIIYNPQSLKRVDRERRVAHALRNNALAGARLPDTGIPVPRRFVETHDVYCWGYGKWPLTNSLAGVQLCLNRSVLKENNIVQAHSFPESLQGRGGALRKAQRCWFLPQRMLPSSQL